jgi:hypothetical protein
MTEQTGFDAFTPQQRGMTEGDPIAAPEARPMPVQPPPVLMANDGEFTHYVWLADGRVLRAALAGHPDTLGARHYETDASGVETSVPIVGVYPR